VLLSELGLEEKEQQELVLEAEPELVQAREVLEPEPVPVQARRVLVLEQEQEQQQQAVQELELVQLEPQQLLLRVSW
jgi:hypothetical protein